MSNQIERMLFIMKELPSFATSNRFITAKILTERYNEKYGYGNGFSQKTTERALADLNAELDLEEGLVIGEDQSKTRGWRIGPNTNIPFKDFSHQEALDFLALYNFALDNGPLGHLNKMQIMAAKATQALSDYKTDRDYPIVIYTNNGIVRQSVEKIAEAMEAKPLAQLSLFEKQAVSISRNREILAKAIYDDHEVLFDYAKDGVRKRRVLPISIAYKNANQYLLAFEKPKDEMDFDYSQLGANDIRLYALPRMRTQIEVIVHPNGVKKPLMTAKDLLKKLQFTQKELSENGEEFEVEMKVHGRIAQSLTDAPFNGMELVNQAEFFNDAILDKDKHAHVKFMTADTIELRQYLLSIFNAVEIIAPEALRDKLVTAVNEGLARNTQQGCNTF